MGDPFPRGRNGAPFSIGYFSGLSFAYLLTAIMVANSNYIQINDPSNSGGTTRMLDESNNGTTGEIQLSGWFRAQWSFEWSYTRIISKILLIVWGRPPTGAGTTSRRLANW